MEQWQIGVALLGIAILGIATYEDLKYRAVTPLPLFIYAVFAVVVTVFRGDDSHWIVSVMIVLLALCLIFYTTHKAEHAMGKALSLPEGDMWILTAAMAGTLTTRGLALFWIALAFVELFTRIGAIIKYRSFSKGLGTPLPLAPEVLVAYVVAIGLLFYGFFDILEASVQQSYQEALLEWLSWRGGT